MRTSEKVSILIALVAFVAMVATEENSQTLVAHPIANGPVAAETDVAPTLECNCPTKSIAEELNVESSEGLNESPTSIKKKAPKKVKVITITVDENDDASVEVVTPTNCEKDVYVVDDKAETADDIEPIAEAPEETIAAEEAKPAKPAEEKTTEGNKKEKSKKSQSNKTDKKRTKRNLKSTKSRKGSSGGKDSEKKYKGKNRK